jgi:hypothetical protein
MHTPVGYRDSHIVKMKTVSSSGTISKRTMKFIPTPHEEQANRSKIEYYKILNIRF